MSGQCTAYKANGRCNSKANILYGNRNVCGVHKHYKLERSTKYRTSPACHSTYEIKQCDATCSICLDAIEGKDGVAIDLCKHSFHQVCLKKWEKMGRKGRKYPKCPECRGPIKGIVRTTVQSHPNGQPSQEIWLDEAPKLQRISAPPPSHSWVCTWCTFINIYCTTECTMCCVPKE
jgi:hypothetical protein